jgi:hypothetical protein
VTSDRVSGKHLSFGPSSGRERPESIDSEERCRYDSLPRESGGTGRRAGFRNLWVKPWGFESPLSHQDSGSAAQRLQSRPDMDGENRIPPALIVGLVLVVLVIGAAAYYAGRFRRSPTQTPATTVELPPPGAPAPDVVEGIEAPPDIPPTVAQPLPVVVEKGSRPSTVMVQKSTEIVVPVPPIVPTVIPAGTPIEADPTARRRIVIEVRPTLTPTVPGVELRAPPPPVMTPEAPREPPSPEETPEPEPTARPSVRL